MNTMNELPRILPSSESCNALVGDVRWSPVKSLWLIVHCTIALVGGFLTFSFDALLVFICTTALTLCLGHSLGMHRLLIHRSYECPKWLDYFFVHLGTLVGMAGPVGMTKTHDLRDWAQRQTDCHTFLRHGESFWRDHWWQLHCDLQLDSPPEFHPEPRIRDDAVYQFMERHWMLQQLPLAILLFAIGGIPYVIWGISARVAVSVIGHWLVGYFAHNSGEIDHIVDGAAVQGRNVKWCAYMTMGESWHNNHHAFPGSAILGVYEDQPDPGWWVLNALLNLGLVWNVITPRDLPPRENLRSVMRHSKSERGMKGPRECPVLSVFQ